MQNKTTLLKTYSNETEAQLDAMKLKEAGIDCMVTNGFMGTLLPIATGGVRLMVFDDDLQRARQLLEIEEA